MQDGRSLLAHIHVTIATILYLMLLLFDCADQLKTTVSKFFSIFSEIFGVQLESWNDIRNWDSLVNNLNSPTDGKSYIQTLNLPLGQRLENIGRRMRTYFLAPETGTYRFYIACDDKCQLNLSTDEKLENVLTLVTVKRWTRYKEWERYEFKFHFVSYQIFKHF